ncbi:putative uncharacterized protein ASB16-AS1 [Mesoplodon densirostris]|uniref:putative uncharacterized protein ASB16-AS1 n=1 Tax=Mesoplodon densirostris TaxID=48708 RepID=UPI0028DB1BA0|nr:putative uncharacterized protein ASB16-AS1 [Mesoplodon densirostris]
MILPQILPQLSSLAEPEAPSCIQKELSRRSPGEEGAAAEPEDPPVQWVPGVLAAARAATGGQPGPRSAGGAGSGPTGSWRTPRPPLRGRGAGRGDARTPHSAAAPGLCAAGLPGAAPTSAGPDRRGCHGSSSITDRSSPLGRRRASWRTARHAAGAGRGRTP